MGELLDKDTEHLRLLTIFYYVNAGLSALSAFFAMVFIAMGLVFATVTKSGNTGNPPPLFVGYALLIVGAALLLVGLAFSASLALVGRFLSQRRHRVFCLVIAALDCLSFPYGTVLGVFTFMVLMRPSVQALFGSAPPPLPAAPLE
jgi:hypothetical protein